MLKRILLALIVFAAAINYAHGGTNSAVVSQPDETPSASVQENGSGKAKMRSLNLEGSPQSRDITIRGKAGTVVNVGGDEEKEGVAPGE